MPQMRRIGTAAAAGAAGSAVPLLVRSYYDRRTVSPKTAQYRSMLAGGATAVGAAGYSYLTNPSLSLAGAPTWLALGSVIGTVAVPLLWSSDFSYP